MQWNETSSARLAEKNWYAVRTANRHEKKVAAKLEIMGMEPYVPLLRTPRRWEGKRKDVIVEVPIFPGYVFVHLGLADRVQVLRVSGVASFVEGAAGPTPVGADVIDTIRASVGSYTVSPHACLSAGRVANVICGPLAGRRGIVSFYHGSLCIVFNVEVANSGIAVFIPRSDLAY